MDTFSILVPIDFSKLSLKALREARHFAQQVQAEAYITPVHVAEPPPERYPTFPKNRHVDEMKRDLNDLAAEHVEAEYLKEAVVLKGKAANRIVELAAEYNMIVTTSRGQSGFSRLMLGSVAEKLLRLSPVPVLVVKEDSDLSNLQRIMVATDFSRNSYKAFPLALTLARDTGSSIDLVHAVSYEHYLHSMAPEHDLPGQRIEEWQKVLENIETARQEQLNELIQQRFSTLTEEYGLQINGQVITTDLSIHEALVNHVQENSYDLTIMSSLGRTGLEHIMLGSTAARVVRLAPAACMVINPSFAYPDEDV